MKKVLIFFIVCLFLSAFATTAKADSSATADSISGVTTGDFSSSVQISSTSESKPQPPSVQDLNFLHPMSLFVSAFDFRNIMDIVAFIHKHPAPYRWQLEKWAEGSSSDITIASLDGPTTSGNRNDQILFTLDATSVALTLNTSGKVVSEAKHLGSGTGNTDSAKVISIQNLCRFALAAMDRGHNIFEIKAQVIAEQVQGSAGGFALGGGLSNVNNGGTAFSIPAIIGYAKGKAGKIGLEGIQAELYYKSVISFEEDGAKTRRQIEELWRKQRESAKEKADLEKLRKDAEKEKLQFEKKKYELEREKAGRELEALKRTPPIEAAKPAPRPTTPPKPEAVAPPPEKCEAEKKEILRLKTEVRETEDLVRELQKELDAHSIPPAPAKLFYIFNKPRQLPGQEESRKKIAAWVKENQEKINALDAVITPIGFCDECGPESVNDQLGHLRAREARISVGAEPALKETLTKQGFDNIRPLSASKDWPVVRKNTDKLPACESQANRVVEFHIIPRAMLRQATEPPAKK